MKRSPSPGVNEPPLPSSFVVELTRRCNHACSYCYTAWGAPGLYPGSVRDQASLDHVQQTIATLCDQAPVTSIALSGGEPLMRDDLAQIVTFIRDRGVNPVVITNGTLMTEARADELGACSVFEVTLLSDRKEIHDQIVRRAGAWEQAVDGIANLAQRKMKFVVAFIATKRNAADLRQTAELAIALGADALMYNRLNLGAFNSRWADDLLPTPDMIRDNLATLDALAATYGLPVTVSVVVEPCVVDTRPYHNIAFGWCPLGGEKSYFTIDPVGNIRVCNHSPTILGNIHRDRFADIYYHHPFVRDFRESLPDECAGCPPDLLSLCRGGCKAAAEQVYGTTRRVDPFVTRNRTL